MGANGNGINATVLIIDDDEMSRYTLKKRLLKFGYNIITLDKAEDALYLIKNGDQPVDFVITDINLRKMDGIELLRHISNMEFPAPVLLIGQGNIDDAVKALRYGAVDFLKKPCDTTEVASIIRNELKRRQEELLSIDFGQYCVADSREYSLPADVEMANVISYELTKNLSGIGLCNTQTAENIALALREAVSNAMFHGNLEMSSKIRETDGIKAYNEEIEQRKNNPLYADRRVKLRYELTPDYVEYIIEDEGKGFDYKTLPDPRDPENFFKKSGRGVLIIRIHMDEAEWIGRGNILRMRKNRIEK